MIKFLYHDIDGEKTDQAEANEEVSLKERTAVAVGELQDKAR